MGILDINLVCIEGEFKALDDAEEQDIEATKAVDEIQVGLICMLQGRLEASDVDMGDDTGKGMKESGTTEGESEVGNEEDGLDNA